MSGPDLCRKHGISEATFYAWRHKYGGIEVADAKRLKALEAESTKLKKMLAEQMMDVATPKEMRGKSEHGQDSDWQGNTNRMNRLECVGKNGNRSCIAWQAEVLPLHNARDQGA